MSVVEFEYILNGEEEPVMIEVTKLFVQKPDKGADNPFDYYGYTECEFDVYRQVEKNGRKVLVLDDSVDVDREDELNIEETAKEKLREWNERY